MEENPNKSTKDTLKKVAEYAKEETKKRGEKLRTLLMGSVCLMLASLLLFGQEFKGRLYGIVAENVCHNIMAFTIGLSCAGLILYALHCLGALDKISQWKKRFRRNSH